MQFVRHLEIHQEEETHSEAPAQHPEAPAQHPEAPAQHPEAPAQHPEAPAQHPEAPTQHAAQKRVTCPHCKIKINQKNFKTHCKRKHSPQFEKQKRKRDLEVVPPKSIRLSESVSEASAKAESLPEVGTGNGEDSLLMDTLTAARWCGTRSFKGKLYLPQVITMNKEDSLRAVEMLRMCDGLDEEYKEDLSEPFMFMFSLQADYEEFCKEMIDKRQLQVGLSPDAQEQMRMMLCQKESNYIRLKRAKMEKSMFKRIKTLGIGAFGEVCLARKEDTCALYAMKTLRKKDVLLRNQVAHVKAERDILAEADNEWVVRLYYSFQDKDNLYFVMEYIPGGDMMSLLIRLGIFKEELAQFYIAELTCAVESVHKMGFIHRDIKPDNILIDRDGHIKLTDFGLCTGFRWTHDSKYYQSGDHVRQDSMDFSKEWEDPSNCRCTDRLKPLERRKARQHQRCLAHSLVGTPNYIAPEVLLRTGYTQLCDWWSVGVILYEMVVGQPPFLATTPMETQLKVINWKSTLHVPPAAKLSPEASDLIIKLCRGHEDRLGKNSTDEIKNHSFFKHIDFSSDLRQQGAPYVPTIAHSTDTSNFDPVDPDKLWNNDSGDKDDLNDTLSCWFRNGKHPEHAFYEFTFRRFFDDNGHPYSCPKPIQYEEDEAEAEGGAQEARSDLAAQGRELVYV
uniref:non-specific serine/threonine protein kinase n=1 Tax=Knipowitschia caucasica TaxID=637954 RepID=A0AAV2KAZ7_KNICA